MYKQQLQWMPCGMLGVYLKLAIRILQFILGITVFGIYCADIVAASAHSVQPPAAWPFACIVGALTAVTSLMYLLPFVHSYIFFWWDWILVILLAGVIGVFGKAYIATMQPTENPGDFQVMGPDFGRERSAAYIDCVSGGLWLATAVMSTVIYLKIRRLKHMGVQ